MLPYFLIACLSHTSVFDAHVAHMGVCFAAVLPAGNPAARRHEESLSQFLQGLRLGPMKAYASLFSEVYNPTAITNPLDDMCGGGIVTIVRQGQMTDDNNGFQCDFVKGMIDLMPHVEFGSHEQSGRIILYMANSMANACQCHVEPPFEDYLNLSGETA